MYAFSFLIEFTDTHKTSEIKLFGDSKNAANWLISSLEQGDHIRVIKHQLLA